MIRSRFGFTPPAWWPVTTISPAATSSSPAGRAGSATTAKALAAAGRTSLAVRDRSAGEKAVAINEAIGADNVVAGTLTWPAWRASARSSTPGRPAAGHPDQQRRGDGDAAAADGRGPGAAGSAPTTSAISCWRWADPALLNAAEDERTARIVALSSIGHRRSDIHWDDPHYLSRPYDKAEAAYGQSKTANSLFARWLQRPLRGARSPTR